MYLFVPQAIETSRAFGPAAIFFFIDLGKRVADQLDKTRAYSFLLQHVAVEVQLGNTAAILGTLY